MEKKLPELNWMRNCRESQFTRAEIHEQKTAETRAWVEKPELDGHISGGSVWTTLREKTPGGPSLQVIPTFVSFISWSSRHKFSQWISDKNLILPSGRGIKEPFWNVPEHSVVNIVPREKLLNQRLTCSDFIRAKVTWGKGNCPTPSDSIPTRPYPEKGIYPPPAPSSFPCRRREISNSCPH